MILTSVSVCYSYFSFDPHRITSILYPTKKPFKAKPKAVFSSGFTVSNQAFPHVVLCAVMTGYCLLFMHVQVVVRFFTSIPAIYWGLAHFLVHAQERRRGGMKKQRVKRQKGWVVICDGVDVGKVILGWFIGYGAVGVLLFTCFYPPA